MPIGFSCSLSINHLASQPLGMFRRQRGASNKPSNSASRMTRFGCESRVDVSSHRAPVSARLGPGAALVVKSEPHPKTAAQSLAYATKRLAFPECRHGTWGFRHFGRLDHFPSGKLDREGGHIREQEGLKHVISRLFLSSRRQEGISLGNPRSGQSFRIAPLGLGGSEQLWCLLWGAAARRLCRSMFGFGEEGLPLTST